MTGFKPKLLSVVVPVYKGEPFLDELYLRVKENALKVFSDFELILVNDASPDQSWKLIEKLCANDRRVKGINLSRNFGQHYAITAGLSFVRGEWCVVMDCDLQDRPEEIPLLFARVLEGYDSVFAQRVNRQHSFLKCFQSKMFYQVFSYLTNSKLDASVANFGIYHWKVIDAILAMGDKIRYFPAMAQWVGFHKAYCPVQHEERKSGTSSYSFFKLLGLAMDTILSFSEKPLKLFVSLGLILTLVSFFVSVGYFILGLLGYFKVLGFASLIISIWLLSGIMMTMLGVLGIYLGKVFNQVKNRPTFIVWGTLNVEEGDLPTN
jgi:glycosyltransferase involved in cell wall biosynthesis